MPNQPIGAQLNASNTVDQSASWAKLTPGKVHRLLTSVQYAVTLLGITALFVLGLMFFKPGLGDKLIALSPFSANASERIAAQAPPLQNLMTATANAIAVTQTTTEEHKILGTPHHQQKLVTSWLSKRYRVASDAIDMLVSAAYITAHDIKLDPLLILAVMAIESRFNPFAESPMGAQGLMQVMSKVHHDKFQQLGGVQAALNPVVNIKVGSLILKEYVTRGGSVEAGLKSYVGAAGRKSDGGYGLKVLSEYWNLKQVAIGKNVSIFTATPSRPRLPPPAAKPVAVDNIAAATPKKPDNTIEERVAL
ncbi:MAG TPA: transglycosylase SLT domain-containing protein [Herbaspirillum sp.]|nr:transglycosylase SLT domain-containing protein [Herbaspirillum sp.]